MLLSFSQGDTSVLDILGKQAKTKVFAYKQRHLLCKQCQKYGHNKNNCNGEVRCDKCRESGHGHEKCHNQQKCHRGGEQHQAGSRQCREYKYQEEIRAVQAKEKVTRNQAKTIFNRRNPTYRKMNSAKAVQETMTTPAEQVGQHSEQPNQLSKSSIQTTQTEILCMSPHCGTLFTAAVNIPDSITGNKDSEKQKTTGNSNRGDKSSNWESCR